MTRQTAVFAMLLVLVSVAFAVVAQVTVSTYEDVPEVLIDGVACGLATIVLVFAYRAVFDRRPKSHHE